MPTSSSVDEVEPETTNESLVDENNESENKSQSSSSSSSNDGHSNSQQILAEPSDEKRRDSNPVWKSETQQMNRLNISLFS